MHQSEHARQMTQRFRELVESSGDIIPDRHYDELALIIESGLDTALLDIMGKISGKLLGAARARYSRPRPARPRRLRTHAMATLAAIAIPPARALKPTSRRS